MNKCHWKNRGFPSPSSNEADIAEQPSLLGKQVFSQFSADSARRATSTLLAGPLVFVAVPIWH
jgi:hypothetical protein